MAQETERGRIEHLAPQISEDGADLPQSKKVEVRRSVDALVDAMDWSAVALLLAERADLPAILVADSGEILLVASAAERQLGWSYASVGKNWIDAHVVPHTAKAARWLFERALSGALPVSYTHLTLPTNREV